jgi:hypothetical protein
VGMKLDMNYDITIHTRHKTQQWTEGWNACLNDTMDENYLSKHAAIKKKFFHPRHTRCEESPAKTNRQVFFLSFAS